MIQGLYKLFDHWHTNGTVWLVSDTHFNDQELYIGTKHVMRENASDYVKLINSKVGKNDTLIHLGDVGDINAVRSIKGYKVLVMGNHDSGRRNHERYIYKEKFDSKEYTKPQILEIMQEKYPYCCITISGEYYDTQHEPFSYYLAFADNCLFDEIYEGPLVISEKLILSHEPIQGLVSMMNIHGHVHEFNYKNDKYHYNICPDATGHFEPINFNRLVKEGVASHINSIHRQTIDNATKRARKRGKRK